MTTIIAGVNNASNLFIVPAELLNDLSVLLPSGDGIVSFDEMDPTVQAILTALLGPNKTSNNGAANTVNIDVTYELSAFTGGDLFITVSKGAVFVVDGHHYPYLAPGWGKHKP